MNQTMKNSVSNKTTFSINYFRACLDHLSKVIDDRDVITADRDQLL